MSERWRQIEAGFGGVKLETVDRVFKALKFQIFTLINREDAARIVP